MLCMHITSPDQRFSTVQTSKSKRGVNFKEIKAAINVSTVSMKSLMTCQYQSSQNALKSSHNSPVNSYNS